MNTPRFVPDYGKKLPELSLDDIMPWGKWKNLPLRKILEVDLRYIVEWLLPFGAWVEDHREMIQAEIQSM